MNFYEENYILRHHCRNKTLAIEFLTYGELDRRNKLMWNFNKAQTFSCNKLPLSAILHQETNHYDTGTGDRSPCFPVGVSRNCRTLFVDELIIYCESVLSIGIRFIMQVFCYSNHCTLDTICNGQIGPLHCAMHSRSHIRAHTLTQQWFL